MAKREKNKMAAPLIFTDDILNNTEQCRRILEKIEEFSASKSRAFLQIIINCSGGSPTAAFAIFDSIKRLGLETETIVQGDASSAGSIIMLAGERRYITRHSSFLLHDPKFLADGWHNERDYREMADELKAITRMYAELVSEKTGQGIRWVRQAMRKVRRFYAQDAVKYGFAHKII